MSTDIEQRYDAIPYLGIAFAQTHPDRLAVLGMLCGLDPRPPVRARVLEIGGGDGGNLIPFACAMPEAQFLGFDLSGEAVQRGQRVIRDLGLKNIELRQQDILEFDRAEGPFDYVIAHGVYSWVPDAVRASLVDLIRAVLAPNGLAFISYAVMPGGHLTEMMRQIMLYHVRDIADPAQQVKAVQALSESLPSIYPEGSLTRALFEQELSRLRAKPENVLLHDDLSPVVHREWRHEFRAAMGRKGLRVVSDARWSMLADKAFTPAMQRWLTEISPDPETREQYRDIMLLLRYREDIVCRADAPSTHAPDRAGVAKLRLRAAAHGAGPVDLAPGREVEFKSDSGVAVTLDGPIVKAAMAELGRIYPWSIDFAELYRRASAAVSRSGTAPQTGPDHLAGALFQMLDWRLVQPTTFDPPFARGPSERPVASPLARYQARGGTSVTSLMHAIIELNDAKMRGLLAMLDGTHDRSAIARELQVPTAQLDTELARLHRAGLLVA